MNNKKKVTVYLPEEMIKRLKTEAIEKDTTLSMLVESIATKAFGKAGKNKKAADK